MLLRLFSTLSSLALLISGGFFALEYHPEWKTTITSLLDSPVQSLTPKYDIQHALNMLEPTLRSQQYILAQQTKTEHLPLAILSVKYPFQETTKEGIEIWDLVCGEMILHADVWDQSHGLSECLTQWVTSDEFSILVTLAQLKGSLSLNALAEKLSVEPERLVQILQKCMHKHLILEKNGNYKIHMHNPILKVPPETVVHSQLTIEKKNVTNKLPKKHSVHKVSKTAEALFGPGFHVKEHAEAFLPIYVFTIKSADGSLSQRYFNSFNGKEMPAMEICK